MQNKISRRQFLLQVTGASAAALLLAGLSNTGGGLCRIGPSDRYAGALV